VTEQLPWLFQELGFRIVEDRFDPKEGFGNSIVKLESANFRVLLSRDRGQILADVAAHSDPETWWNLEHVCEIISGQSINPDFELSAAATLLRNNVSALADYLGPKFPETKRELERRAAERTLAWLRRFSR